MLYEPIMLYEPVMLYETVMGDQWAQLPEMIRAIHLPGDASGRFKVRRGKGFLARLVLRLGRFPLAGDDIPLRLHVESLGDRLLWRRQFGDRLMMTWQDQRGDLIREGRGPFYVAFRLVLKGGGLDHVQAGAGLKLGPLCLPFPRWLQPQVSGETRAHGEEVQALVNIRVPVIGFLLSYEGCVRPADSL